MVLEGEELLYLLLLCFSSSELLPVCASPSFSLQIQKHFVLSFLVASEQSKRADSQMMTH